MTTIEFFTSAPKYQPKVVADITFPAIVMLGVQTVDRRMILGPRRAAKVSVRLPANIMTDYRKGPLRPGVSQIANYRMVGAVLDVTITDDVMSGHGILYKPLPADVEFWPGADMDNVVAKFYKNGRADMNQWTLRGVTLRDHGPVWPDLPPVTITPRNT